MIEMMHGPNSQGYFILWLSDCTYAIKIRGSMSIDNNQGVYISLNQTCFLFLQPPLASAHELHHGISKKINTVAPFKSAYHQPDS